MDGVEWRGIFRTSALSKWNRLKWALSLPELPKNREWAYHPLRMRAVILFSLFFRFIVVSSLAALSVFNFWFVFFCLVHHCLYKGWKEENCLRFSFVLSDVLLPVNCALVCPCLRFFFWWGCPWLSAKIPKDSTISTICRPQWGLVGKKGRRRRLRKK